MWMLKTDKAIQDVNTAVDGSGDLVSTEPVPGPEGVDAVWLDRIRVLSRGDNSACVVRVFIEYPGATRTKILFAEASFSNTSASQTNDNAEVVSEEQARIPVGTRFHFAVSVDQTGNDGFNAFVYLAPSRGEAEAV